MPTTTYWCLLRSNRAVKNAVKLRMKERKLTLRKLCSLTDVPINKLSHYLNNKKESVSQEQLMRITKFLEIEIELNVSFS